MNPSICQQIGMQMDVMKPGHFPQDAQKCLPVSIIHEHR